MTTYHHTSNDMPAFVEAKKPVHYQYRPKAQQNQTQSGTTSSTSKKSPAQGVESWTSAISEAISWHNPNKSAAIFGTFNFFCLLSFLTDNVVGWAIWSLTWIVFPCGMVAKFLRLPEKLRSQIPTSEDMADRIVTMFSAQENDDGSTVAGTPAVTPRTPAVEEVVRDAVKTNSESLMDILSWKNPHQNLRILVGLYLVSFVTSHLGLFWLSFLSFNTTMVGRLIYEDYIKDHMEDISKLVYKYLHSAQASVSSVTGMASRLVNYSGLVSWKYPFTATAGLAAINLAIIASSYFLFTTTSITLLSWCAFTVLLGAFAAESMFGFDALRQAGFLNRSIPDSLADTATQTLHDVSVNTVSFTHQLMDVLTWKDWTVSLPTFLGCLLGSRMYSMLGFTGLVLFFVNGYALSRHPQVQAMSRQFASQAKAVIRSIISKEKQVEKKVEEFSNKHGKKE